MAVAGLTPIPYKVFTISSGVFRINMRTFLYASLLGRGIRFFMEALLIMVLGPAAQRLLSQRLELITMVLAGIIILVFVGINSIKQKTMATGKVAKLMMAMVRFFNDVTEM